MNSLVGRPRIRGKSQTLPSSVHQFKIQIQPLDQNDRSSHSPLGNQNAIAEPTMKKKKILYLREPEVHTILKRQLANEGYFIWPKVGLEEVMRAEPEDYLNNRELQYVKHAHIDFVVAHQDQAVFLVEFDGINHINDPAVMERDLVKNRLCKLADLPLLRVMSTEIQELDQITVLDYMLKRYVAWKNEYPEIIREIDELASRIGLVVTRQGGRPTMVEQKESSLGLKNYDPENLCTDLDPSFHFDLRHPFPGTALVRARLWRNYRIAWSLEAPYLRETPVYLCDVNHAEFGSLGRDQFRVSRQTATVWKGSDRSSLIFTEKVSASLRSWLPVYNAMPELPHVEQLWKEFYSSSTPEKIGQKIVHAFKLHAENMWFPNLPGLRADQIVQNYSEYLGFRAIERWAKKQLPHPSRDLI